MATNKSDSMGSIFVICGFSPNPKATSSGQKIAYTRIIELAQQYKEVRLLYFVNEIDALDCDLPPWPENVKVVASMRITRMTRLLALLRHPLLPSFVAARQMAARSVVHAQLSDPSVTNFFADFAQGLAAVPKSHVHLFALRQHDVVSHLYTRLAEHKSGLKRVFYLFEAAKARRWEKQVWSRVMEIATHSPKEAEEVKKAVPRAQVRYERVGSTVIVDPSVRTEATIVPGRIGFWGNMAREENVEAVLRFVKCLLPEIRKIHPNAQFWIIGAHPTDEVLALESDAVHVTGFVEDPAPIFATLDISVAPLRLGSGVKVKVFETLDAGIPTVVSPVGGEGIETHPLLQQANSDAEMIEIVGSMLIRSQDLSGVVDGPPSPDGVVR